MIFNQASSSGQSQVEEMFPSRHRWLMPAESLSPTATDTVLSTPCRPTPKAI